MKLTSRRMPAMLMVWFLCAALLGGCAGASDLEDAFTADDPALGVLAGSVDSEVSYYAEDLCVTAEDVDELSVDTSESYGACFFRLDTAEVLYANNIHEQLYPASTTKIMTALLAIENGDLDASTTVSETAVTFTESGVSTAGLKAGDVLTLQQLLYALLLPSANDAANVIAEMIAGSTEAFADMMNERAQEIGATNSHFVNPNGLHDEDHYTTVYDLYLIFQEAIQYDTFLEVIQTEIFETTYTAADGTAVEATWSNSDQFTSGGVSLPEGFTALGGKTGTTSVARSCLVQLFEDSAGQRYVAIILGCSERAILYQEMQSFLEAIS